MPIKTLTKSAQLKPVTVTDKIMGKKCAKDFIKKSYSISSRKRKMLLSVFLSEENFPDSFELLQNLLHGLRLVSVSVVIAVPEKIIKKVKTFKSRSVAVIPWTTDTYKGILSASDISLILPCSKIKSCDLKPMLKAGVVPIALESQSQIKNYDPNKEEGNSFTIKRENEWEIFAAIVRALETYRFRYDWTNIVQDILRQWG